MTEDLSPWSNPDNPNQYDVERSMSVQLEGQVLGFISQELMARQMIATLTSTARYKEFLLRLTRGCDADEAGYRFCRAWHLMTEMGLVDSDEPPSWHLAVRAEPLLDAVEAQAREFELSEEAERARRARREKRGLRRS